MNVRRNRLLRFFVSDREYSMIRTKMEQMQIRNLSAYLRKMAIDGFCVYLDIAGFKELTSLMRRCSNNLNQYAKIANSNGSIFNEDIEELKKMMEKIYQVEEQILQDLQHLPA